MNQRALWSLTQAVIATTLLWSVAGVVSRRLESTLRLQVAFWRNAFDVLSLFATLPLWRASNRRFDRVMNQPALVAHRSVLTRWMHRYRCLLPESPASWVSGLCWGMISTAFMVAPSFISVAIGASVACMLAVTTARVLQEHELALLRMQGEVFGNLWPWLWVNEAPDVEVLAGGSVVLGALAINELGGRQLSCQASPPYSRT